MPLRHPMMRGRVPLALALLLLAACGGSETTAPVANPLTVDRDSIEFDVANAYEGSMWDVTVTNGGTAEMPVVLRITGAARTSFAIDSARSDCVGATLAAGQFCDAVVILTTESPADQLAQLTVGTGRSGELPVTVPIVARGSAPLALRIEGSGSGSVLAAEVNTMCTESCPLRVGATTTLTASADLYSYFVGWSGACTGTGSCTPGLQGDTVTATFNKFPETTITRAPLAATNDTTARWEFTTDVGTSFECSLDGLPWEPCTSPHEVSGLAAEYTHTLKVRAIDALGQRDPAYASSSVLVTRSTPLLRYEFEGTATNTGALSGHDGTVTSVTWPAGRFGSAVKFDGTAATSVVLPGTADVLGSDYHWTISLWYREDTILPNVALFTIRSHGPTDHGWESYRGVYVDSAINSCSAGGCFAFLSMPGTWHNLVYRFDGPSRDVGGPVSYFVDGKYVGAIDNTAGVPLTSLPLGDIVLGNSYYGAMGNASAADPSVFYVDRLEVYNAVFSAAEQCTRVMRGTWNAASSSCAIP